jgi:hypothetical protein
MQQPIRQLAGALVAAAIGALCLAGAAHADERHGPPGPGFRLDERYHHDHYYPPRGYAVPVLPRGAVSIAFGGGNYFFHGGVWFRPFGGRFVVTVPPIGVVVPILPPAYVTLPMAGGPVYYANGVYYAPAPGQGYTVVPPPPGADSVQPLPPPPPPPATPTTPPPPPDPIVYPRNGQSAAQSEADRQECNRWATTQPNAVADASVFQRAVAACLDGRGYTVR